MQLQPVSTIYDDFNGSVLDTSKWRVESNLGTGPDDPNSSYTIAGSTITLQQAGSTEYWMVSKDSFTWDDTTLVIGPISGEFYMPVNGGRLRVQGGVLYADGPFPGSGTNMPYNPSTMRYFKLVSTTTKTTLYYSPNNHDWTQAGTYDIWTAGTTMPIRIAVTGAGKSFTLGAINPPPNAPPVAGILEPGDLSTATSPTPQLSFEAIDPDGDKVSYQIQMSTTKTFDILHFDVLSASNPGFGGTDPYNNGATVTYTVQTPLESGGVTYYWRVRAKDPSGKNEWGNWSPVYSIISEPLPPTVSSVDSSAITSTGAVISGDVTSDGGGAIIERGVAYGDSPNPTISGSKKIAAGSTGAFNLPLTDLIPNKIYNWRAYATNAKTTTYGENKTFTTLPGAATITSVEDVTYNSATVNANILSQGGAEITERGVVYSTVPSPTLENNKVVSGSGAGAFAAAITGLTGRSDYYVRAYATNAQGTSYSEDSMFTTEQTPGAPTVDTGTSSNIGEVDAEINGSEVILDGTQPVTERGVVLSYEHDDPTIEDQKVTADTDGLGVFDVMLSALKPETTYYVRAYATNSLGTGYGSVVSFKTLALFIPDQGDGYWTWQPTGSDATIGRSQSTPQYASANLLLSDLGLEDGAEYTLYYSDSESDNGEVSMILQWYDNFVKMQQVISPNTPYTFTYDKDKLSWAIRLYVTGENPEAEPINATFHNMYLAKEPSFSGYIPFVNKGITEVKLSNNWILDKQRENTIDRVFSAIDGIGWRGFTAKTTGLGWIEVGDQVTISEPDGDKKVIVWDSKLTIDGGIKETIGAEDPQDSETDYDKASTITKALRRTQISVDHNEQEIQSIAEDIYSDGGVINTRFSEVVQDIESVRTTVQSSGGVNLVKNSVMYAFSDEGEPDQWQVTGDGTLTIQASPESLSGGGMSGNVFSLADKTVAQTVTVRKDVDYVLQQDKLYYSFSARVRKNIVGNASITLSNRNETHTIELPDQKEYFWEEIQLEGLLPLDDHFTITIYSDADANLQVTDVMLSPGENTRQWTQANGEAMNTNVAITDDGMTIRSNVFRNDYTRINALGFEVRKHEAGGERVFGFNGDETNVRKLRADSQISLAPMRMVPIDYGPYEGMAFTRTEDN